MSANRKRSPIAEIAQLAGVSKAAVYATLNPKSSTGIGVGAETKARILAAVEKVGYVRNELASSLVTGRSKTIGICVQSLRGGFFDNFFEITDSLAHAEGYSLLLSSSEFDANRERRNILSFAARRVDAIAVACSCFDALREDFEKIESSGSPIVIIGEDHARFRSTEFDESEATRLQASHLLAGGHRKVVHLSAANASSQAMNLHRVREERFLKTWRELSSEEALDLRSSNLSYPDPWIVDSIAEKARKGEIDAVACSADSLALGLLSALKAKGLEAPNALSVIGYDDLPESESFFTPLTTIRLPREKLAKSLWAILTNAIKGGAIEHRRVAPELIIRKSA